MKKIDLLDAINAKKQQVLNLVNEDKLEEAKKAKAELQTMQDKLDLLEGIEPENNAAPKEAAPMNQNDVIHTFADAARHKFQNMNEGTAADGGYTVPEDIQTKINEFKEAQFSLKSLVSVEKVSTYTGRRTYKTKGLNTGFTAVGEGTAIGEATAPKFEKVDYTIKKYGGYLPVTNELLADSDANITNFVTKWLADESVATENAQIIAAIKAGFTETALADLDAIKSAVNVTIGSAYDSIIVTNDDGLNYLDTLKDANKRYVLTPDAQNPMQMVLACGARRIPVKVVPNAILKTTEGDSGKSKIPFFIGDMAEAIEFFDREQLSVKSSDVAAVTGVNAFEDDMTLFRGIIRFDAVKKDGSALVNGYIEK